MSFIDKTSLRSEFDSLKQQFEDLKSQGSLNRESLFLMQSMFTLFEILISVFMEKKTKKTSKNSSLPSSQSDKDNTSTNIRNSHSKGKVQKSGQLPSVETTVKVEKSEVNFCTHCGEDLSKIKATGKERRTHIDIFFEKRVVHIDAEIKECPYCEEMTKGWFPSSFKGPLQYGNNIKIFVLNLLIAQMVPLKRVQKLVQSLIGKMISEASMLRWILKLHMSLESWEEEQISKLLSMESLHVDETSMKVGGKNYWIHVYSSSDITLKFIHPKRGGEAIEDIGIIPKYGGVIIHDCWASYLSYGNCGHALCGSHLLRELTFIVESNEYRWASNMKFLLKETSRIVAKREDKKLTDSEYKNLQKRYRNILTRGKKELPEIVKKSKSRGRIAKSDAHNLWERLKNYEESVLKFSKYSYVSFTNNRAEQDLRMNKVKQKVSGSFRSYLHAQAYCRIFSYIKTQANIGTSSMIALHQAWAKIGNDELI
jgi:transposase